ncbi:bcl-2 homologous antagonist/killer [Strongylocentrotus purpuratus]|uniref:Bcl-2 homologous antagonist/killer n=1 Tax=Strongylocentrotus purpuratus TaxID=7668 RepID=A0A7M7NZF3_STRPU|nr:bcl-2 homologous antagonist/killer [Strongylocentrotus purpuratus]XP_030843836.1 bcl-2 homologous antagonist/killer-like [Strongylocentrotus purpuratus]XP_793197.1 bcl-2 homologous antagonist/killer [Strongylocentrotus purpuratus]|eukprot:XP_011661300.1 PREDICTED: bcl-2 homologous antagonist/killer [Strongylocentrotus purpuratus]
MATGTSTITQTVQEDTEENVIEQTEMIVRNFFHQRLAMDMQDQTNDINISTPRIPELQNFTADPLSPTSRVGRRLAQIGDQIDAQYEGEFRQMIQMLHITPSTAYQAFAGVARRLFIKGINWGRISALLMFGYRIARDVMTSVGDFFHKIVGDLVRFIISERIATWIAQQGGWISALNFRIENPGVGFIAIAGLSALAIVCAVVWSRSR